MFFETISAVSDPGRRHEKPPLVVRRIGAQQPSGLAHRDAEPARIDLDMAAEILGHVQILHHLSVSLHPAGLGDRFAVFDQSFERKTPRPYASRR